MLIRSHAMNRHQDEPPHTPPDEAEAPLPWEGDPPPEQARDARGRRVRHDAFTARRRHEFLSALAKTGTVEDAARAVRVDPRTVYRHQEKDPAFLGHCQLALRMSAVPIELTAWQRAVEGVEQEFACGGQIHIRRRYDAGLLRLLLQGSNPKKYGPRPGFGRKRILRHERKQIEREVRAEIDSQARLDDEAVKEELKRSLTSVWKRLRAEKAQKKLAAGWTETPDGDWIPPGYGPLPQPEDSAAAQDAEGGETPRMTM